MVKRNMNKRSTLVKVANKKAGKGKFAKKGTTQAKKVPNNKSFGKRIKPESGPPVHPGKVCPKKSKKRKIKDDEQRQFEIKRCKIEEDVEETSGDEEDADGVADYELKRRRTFKKSVTTKDDVTEPQDTDEISVDMDSEKKTEPQPQKEKAKPKVKLPLIELIALKRQAFQETRSLVGKSCVSIISEPEANIDRLQPLLVILDENKDDAVFKMAFIKTQSLVAYSLLEVFQDIIPSYRIREKVSEDEKGVPLKKETMQLRQFEATLLKYYKVYVNRLIRMTESIRKRKTSSFYDSILDNMNAKGKICLVGARCLATLLVSHPHFNLRDNVIDALAPLMSCKCPEVRQLVFDHFTRLYREDKQGQVSLVAVKATGRVIKALKLAVHPLVIRSFLSLNIKEVKKRDETVDMKQVRDKLDKMSRKEKKQNKELQKVKKQMKETLAHEDRSVKLEAHTQILNQIIYVFLRFIKDFLEAPEPETAVKYEEHVMTPVLEGLSKFAHLINIEFFDDLISLLFRLVASGRMSSDQTLFCLNTVFTILSEEGSALNVDPQRFYAKLYTTLLTSDIDDEPREFVASIDSCVDKMLFKRKKQISLARVLAFCKRFMTMSLHSSPGVTAVFLAVVRQLMTDHPKADLLSDTEHFGVGAFVAEMEDPEFCNANATRVWELHLLRKHYHPVVEKFASFHLNNIRHKNIKSDFGLKSTAQVYEEIMNMDSDLEQLLGEPARKRFFQSIKSKKQAVRYCFLDSPDSLASRWTRKLFQANPGNLETIDE